ncbi:MAG: xylanase, partial [Muribaculaceae bacterium]|nr:xylanase [Muribaculaceae bacterium]
IDPDTEFQTIDCFGASDAWSMNTIGLWPEERRQAVADLLFSLNTDASGQPEGIGLSMWRFNIGAGSEYQGDSSLINQGTRTECMLMPDGSFDPMRQAGQRNFLTMARRHGVEHFLGFFNSPPVNYTINGLATNTGRDGTFNLRPEHYGDFARFMADVVESLQKTDSVTLDYICPVNEPDGSWNWLGPKQEGTPATNREVARIARLAAAEMTGRNLPTRILINESSDYRCMTGIHQTDWQRGNHISTFFNPDSTATYLGDTPGIERMMAAHSYWTNTPVDKMGGYRTALRDSMARYGVKLWQTELCIMGNDTEIGGGVPYDRTMKTALYIARVIHHDLVMADASSWQWWRAVGGNYRDGLLMRYRPDGAECDTIVDSKLLWTLGNYSRFIRPGYRRIDLDMYDSRSFFAS